jgi:hypothetical protein
VIRQSDVEPAVDSSRLDAVKSFKVDDVGLLCGLELALLDVKGVVLHYIVKLINDLLGGVVELYRSLDCERLLDGGRKTHGGHFERDCSRIVAREV